jgi:Zn finger protein HypA/HybF involved in hydrogenase expression
MGTRPVGDVAGVNEELMEPAAEGSVGVERPLEAESLADTEGAAECQRCGKPVEEEWQVCPYCGTGLASGFAECGKVK